MSLAAEPSKLSQIGLLEKRRGMENMQSRTMRDKLLMTEASPHGRQWAAQDEHSSRRHRDRELDFKKHLQGRKSIVAETYFEPSKYRIRYGVVDAPVKDGVPQA